MKRMAVVLGLVSLVCVGSVEAGFESYTGSLTGFGGTGDGRLFLGGGFEWISPSTMLSWTVDNQTTPGKWHYVYTLTVSQVDIQCVIVEASDGSRGPVFTEADLFNVSSSPAAWLETVTVGTHSKWEHTNLPSDLYGIKFCSNLDPISLTLSFDSDRAPVWGDFYAMSYPGYDPQLGGVYRNTLYNWGFVAPDPLDAPQDGSVNDHVLVPDSLAVPIPAPGAMLLGTLGVACGGLIRRKWL